MSACASCWTAAALLIGLSHARRNVLFLLEDDGGFSIGAYGDKVIATPHIDGLAACGTAFDAAYTSVSSCSPSRASILTGIPTHQNGQYGLAHDVHHYSAFAGLLSLPNVLNAAGVATGITGKYHVWSSGSAFGGGAGSFNFSWGNNPAGPGGCQTGASYACPNTDYNLVTRNITYMRQQAAGFMSWAGASDWFLYVGFGDSHRCGGAVGEFCELYGRDASGQSTIPDWTPAIYNPALVQLPFWIQDTPAARADYAAMYTAKNRMDQGVGLLLQLLEASGQANDTLVIYFSDNGAPFAAGKTNFYEPGAAEPLIISVPGAAGGGRTSVLASALDMMPTILDWMGVPVPTYTVNGAPVVLSGKSLLPYSGAAAAGADRACTAPHTGGSVHRDRDGTPAAQTGWAPHLLASTTEQLAAQRRLRTQQRRAAAAAGARELFHTSGKHDKDASALASARLSFHRGAQGSLRSQALQPMPLPANYSAVRGSFQVHEVQEYYPMRLLIASEPLASHATSVHGHSTAGLLRHGPHVRHSTASQALSQPWTADDTSVPTGAGDSAKLKRATDAAPDVAFRYKLVYNIAGGFLPYPIAADLWTAPAFQDLLNRTRSGQPTHWYRNFTEYLAPRPRYQLFDLLQDPAELTDVATDPAYAAILATLQADLRAWQTDTNDPFIVKYVHE